VDKTRIIRIKRYSTEEQIERFDKYTVPFKDALTVQGVLRHIFENCDPTLAFRDYRCGQGICGVCKVKVNGKSIRACETIVKAESEITIEPVSDQPLKDLVVTHNNKMKY